MNTLTKEWLLKTIAELEEERDAVPGVVNEDAVMALAAMKLALASLEAEPVYQVFSFKRWRDVSEEVFGEEKKDGCQVRVLYTAPPAPVAVLDDNAITQHFDTIALETAREIMCDVNRRHEFLGGEVQLLSRIQCRIDDACRTAMLQGAELQNRQQNIPENIPATQFKPVADLYGLTSPTGGETSFTFDAVEARDFIDVGWSCQEYVELGRLQEAMFQNGNSPAQSDCFPEQNYIAPAQDGDSPALPDGWVTCSERMPGIGTEIFYFCQDDGLRDCGIVSSSNFSGKGDAELYVHAEGYDLRFGVDITHWMPLPAAPQQEVK